MNLKMYVDNNQKSSKLKIKTIYILTGNYVKNNIFKNINTF